MAKKLTDYNLNDLYKWIESGMTTTAPTELMEYVNLLEKIYRMMNRVDIYGSRDAIIKHLVDFEPEVKTRIKALDLYNEAFEYFNADTKISKKAWRNFYANKIDQDYEMARAVAETASDFEKASRIADKAYKFRQLDQEDPPELPRSLFDKPIKVYTTDMDQFEIGNEDLKDIEMWIDDNTKELSPAAIDRIKQEAMLIPIKIFDDEQADSTN
ncbi:hypothetical protein [Chryseobacterium caseinilyticum]|uniref:Uncharacterized protein n=1 Tax=Chryseobacterium caseinilyticum TaxID=2771428 RepID=A0ABR8Z7F6_9FLAO|nr:hypothetical protein [Chryseobacterium caseinilyticum]MBD8081141.1 hypothetical protein [Chryseobacterium caseinilyticum]